MSFSFLVVKVVRVVKVVKDKCLVANSLSSKLQIASVGADPCVRPIKSEEAKMEGRHMGLPLRRQFAVRLHNHNEWGLC